MIGHKVVTLERGTAEDGRQGYAARCEHPACSVVTFGGFSTRTAAREAAAAQHRADAERAAADEQRTAETFAQIPSYVDFHAYVIGYWRGLVEHRGHEHAGQWLLRVLELREAEQTGAAS